MGTARAGDRWGRRALRRAKALVAPLVVLACAGTVRAGDPASAPPPPRPAREALTSVEAGALARSDAVALAHVRLIVAGRAGAPTLARATVERALRGSPAKEVTVFVGGPRNVDDPRRVVEPWFSGAALSEQGGRYVLFLRASREGSGWTLEGLFPADGDEGLEKADVLAEEIRLSDDPDPVRRRERTLAFLLGLVEAERPWSRLHGARELAWLAGQKPRLFDERLLGKVETLRGRSFESGVRTALSAALEGAEPGRSLRAPAASPGEAEPAPAPAPAGPPPPPVATPPVAPPPAPGAVPERLPEPAVESAPLPAGSVPAPECGPAPAPVGPTGEIARLRATLDAAVLADAKVTALSALARAGKASVAEDLARRLADPDATVRERAALLLGDVGATGTLPRVVGRFAVEGDPAAREAIVRAVGLLGDATDVPWVVERGADPALFQPACFALARLRTPAAIETLTAWRERAAAAVPRDEATVRLIDYLRGKSFEEAERIAGRPVGPRAASRRDGESPPETPSVPEGVGPR